MSDSDKNSGCTVPTTALIGGVCSLVSNHSKLSLLPWLGKAVLTGFGTFFGAYLGARIGAWVGVAVGSIFGTRAAVGGLLIGGLAGAVGGAYEGYKLTEKWVMPQQQTTTAMNIQSQDDFNAKAIKSEKTVVLDAAAFAKYTPKANKTYAFAA